MNVEILNLIAGLSVRSKNILLYGLELNDINEFVSLSYQTLINTRNCGKKAAAEIQALQQKVMRENGITDAVEILHDGVDYNLFSTIQNKLSVRAINVLTSLEVSTLEGFLSLTKDQLLGTKNCGLGTVTEVLQLQKEIASNIPPAQIKLENLRGNLFTIFIGKLSVRAGNILRVLEISTLEGLLSLTHKKLLGTKNCGVRTVNEIIFAQTKLIAKLLVAQDDDRNQQIEKVATPTYKNAPKLILQVIRSKVTIRSLNTLRSLEIDTLEDFMVLDKKQLLNCKNSGIKTTNEVLKIQTCLHNYAIEVLAGSDEYRVVDLVNAPCLGGIVAEGTDDWDDFQTSRPSDWLYNWVNSLTKSERNADVFMLRMGMRGHKPETLQEIGLRLNLSREQVMQIIKRVKKKMNSQFAQYQLLSLFDYMKEVVVASGGVLSLSELVLVIFCQGEEAHPLRYATTLVDFFTTLLIWESSELQVKDGIIRHEGSPSIVDWLSEVIVEIASANADDKHGNRRWSIGRKRLLGVLQENIASQYPAVCISNALLDVIVSEHEEKLKIHGNRIYSRELWGLRFGSKIELVENVLRGIRKAAHFTDIAKEVRKWQPGYSDHNTYAVLDRSRSALLWGLGTFIHKDYVDVKELSPLLKDIEEWLIDKLKDNIPFISVYGAFREFSTSCQIAGIASEYALYSCLREMNSHGLKYPRMPYIYRRDDFTGEVPASSALEDFIRKAGGAVSSKELESFATQKLYLKAVEQFTQQKQNIQHVIRVANNGYLHLDNYKHNSVAMQEIIEYTHKVLNMVEYCCADKIYHDKQVTCLEADIDSSEMLYSLLQHYAEDRFTFPGAGGRQVSKKQKSDEGSKHSTSSRIVEYVKELRKPCYYSELKKQFVDELGFHERNIYSARNDDNLLDYQPQCLIHKETLQWNEIKQGKLERKAYQFYQDSHKAGKLFGKISRLVYSPNLPELPHGLGWTETLLTSLLAGGGLFILLGSSSEAYVPLDNKDGIQKLEDIIALILESDDWRGVTNHKKFTDYLVELRIIKVSLTSDMLSPGKKVIIRDSLIGLKKHLLEEYL